MTGWFTPARILRQATGISLAVALGATALTVGPERVVAPTPAAAAPEASAAAEAARTGQAVEIPSRTTEISQTFAEPNGTLTTKLSNSVQRVRQGDSWVTADASLLLGSDGRVKPKAVPDPLSLSNGGNDPLVSLTTGDGTMRLRSPWALPRPILNGTTATYAEVRPGVDLVVEASVEGFSYNLVVKTREAALDPAMRALRFPVEAEGIKVRNPQRPEYVAADGRLVFAAGQAVMWDSGSADGAGNRAARSAKTSAQSLDDGPQPGGKTAEMGFTADNSSVTITPNAAILTAADTVFPVVLDPVLKPVTRSGWTAAWQLYPSTNFYKTNRQLGVGYEGYEQNKIVRSYFQFDVGGFAGKKILSATMRNYAVHSASCSARSVSVSRVGPINTSTTWNNQPVYQAEVTSKSFASGWNSSCPDAYVEFPVTGSIAYSAAKGNRTTTFRLRATDETDELAWKQFSSYGELGINYVSPPSTPSSVGVADPAVGCDIDSDPVNISDRTPKLRAAPRLSSNDTNARVLAEFTVHDGAGTVVATGRTGQDSPGTVLTKTLGTALADQKIYHFRARTIYPIGGGDELASAWSGWCYFRTDSTAPPAPEVTASYRGTELSNCQRLITCPEVAPFDEPVTFSIKARAADVVKHTYRFQNNYGTGTANGLNSTVNLIPPQEGWNTLFVRSYDKAGHYSSESVFVLNVKASSGPIASWSLDDGSGNQAADGSGQNRPLTLAAGAAFESKGRMAGSMILDGVDDSAQPAGSIVDTTKSFTISTWARITDLTKQGIVAAATGSKGAAFELYFDQTSYRWVFLRMATDEPGTLHRAYSDDPPQWGVWTHLTATYDSSRSEMDLWVNGRRQDSVNVPSSAIWKATGPLTIGQGKWNGSVVGRYTGSLDQVQLWQRALRSDEIRELADPRKDGVTQSGLAARWPLDTAVQGTDGTYRTPEQVRTANMVVSGFGSAADQAAAFVSDDERGQVLRLTGDAGQSVSLSRAAVDTTASFSAAVWARVDDPTRPMVVARQGDSSKDVWRLEYRPIDSVRGQWRFSRTTGTSTSEQVAVYPVDQDATGEWKLLVATYDAAAPSETSGLPQGQLRLTMNNVPFDGTKVVYSEPSRNGGTALGSDRSGASAVGRVDDFRLYAGALTDDKVCDEYPDLGDQICGPGDEAGSTTDRVGTER